MSEQIAPTERIHELSDISIDVAAMLKAAGQAINSLTGRIDASGQQDDEDNDDQEMTDDTLGTLENQQQTFDRHTTTYYTTLQAITARMRRQVYALEEAGIVSSESAALGNNRSNTSADQGKITNGGLGNLDVGWLNSRGNRVGAEKEQEIVNEIKELLESRVEKGG